MVWDLQTCKKGDRLGKVSMQELPQLTVQTMSKNAFPWPVNFSVRMRIEGTCLLWQGTR